MKKLNRLESLYHKYRQTQGPSVVTSVVPQVPQVLQPQGRVDKKKDVPTIQVKQIVKQIQGGRDRRVKKKTKQSLTLKRKEYNAAKKASRKTVMAEKKVTYERENSKIKKLPVKERKQARAALKQLLKKRVDRALKQLPSGAKLKFDALSKLIQRAKNIKF